VHGFDDDATSSAARQSCNARATNCARDAFPSRFCLRVAAEHEHYGGFDASKFDCCHELVITGV